MEYTKINDMVIRPKKYGKGDDLPARGGELFETAWANIFLSAKKNSGKTEAIRFILKKCMSSQTNLIIFCSTIHKDPAWIDLIKYYKDKGVDIETHTSLKEGKVDLLAELVKELEEEIDEEEEEEEVDPKEKVKQMGGAAAHAIYLHNIMPPNELTGSGKPKRKPKPKFKECDYIIVLDDLSTELKSKSLVGLLKKNRHFRAKIIMSSQYYLDLLPESRLQIDYFLLFKSQSEDKLRRIYMDADISIPYEEFEKAYNDAVSTPYSFLYIDVRRDKFRKNFNIQYKI